MNLSAFLPKIGSFFRKSTFFHGTSLLVFFALIFSPFTLSYELPNPYVTAKWVTILISINILLFLFLYESKILVLPKLPEKVLWILGAILLLIVFNASLHNVPLFSVENIRRFLFWGSVLFFFNLFSFEKEEAFEKIKKCIYVVSTVFMVAALVKYVLFFENPPYLTFGNINLAAEFIGFSFALQFGSLPRLWRRSKKSLYLECLSALSLAYLYLTFCRSIFIGVFLMLFVVSFLEKEFFKKIIKILTFSGLIVFLTKLSISILHPDAILNIEKSFSVRWLVYTNTLKMILENPLGAGVGQFEFASLPYMSNLWPEHNEGMVFLAPHSEFLHFLSEDGVILSFLFFSLAVVLSLSFWKEVKQIFSSHPEFICFSIIIFVQSLFQFPLIDPLPYFMTALMIGYFLSLRKEGSVVYKLSRRLKIILISLNLIALTIFIASFSSRYISLNFPGNEKLNTIACSYGNRDWYACLNVAALNLNKGNYDKAEAYASCTLGWQPLNFQGMKMLGFSLLYQGNRRKACQLFEKYDSFFQNQSSLREIINIECLPIR